MKTIEIKNGPKTVYKIVPDDYVERTKETNGDLTTGNRKSLSYSDVSNDVWDNVFNKEKFLKRLRKLISDGKFVDALKLIDEVLI